MLTTVLLALALTGQVSPRLPADTTRFPHRPATKPAPTTKPVSKPPAKPVGEPVLKRRHPPD